MGDRGNIGIRQPHEDGTIYLYTHWKGSYVCPILAEALVKCREAGRLDDPSYATRIILDTLTGLEGGSTGYGIALNCPPDNEHEIPYVNWGTHGMEPHITYGCGEFTVAMFIEVFSSTNSGVS